MCLQTTPASEQNDAAHGSGTQRSWHWAAYCGTWVAVRERLAVWLSLAAAHMPASELEQSSVGVCVTELVGSKCMTAPAAP